MSDNLTQIINSGSEWHRWEPHIHAPGTVLEDRFPKEDGWDLYLAALEAALHPLRAIAVTDYCITRSYERVKAEKENGWLKGCDLLFPNIELRLNTGTIKGHFINIHILASPEDPDPDHVTELNLFLGRLSFSAFNDRFAALRTNLFVLGGAQIQPESTMKPRWSMAARSLRFLSKISSRHTGASNGPATTSSSRSPKMPMAHRASRRPPTRRCEKKSRKRRTLFSPAA